MSDVFSSVQLITVFRNPIEELIWEIPDSAIKDLIIDDVQIIEEFECFYRTEAVEVIELIFRNEEISQLMMQIQTSTIRHYKKSDYKFAKTT